MHFHPTFVPHLLVFSFILFLMGLYGFLTRRSALVNFICLEVMINAGNLALAAFSYQYQLLSGVLLIFTLIGIAAVEAVVGLGLIWLLHHKTRVNPFSPS